MLLNFHDEEKRSDKENKVMWSNKSGININIFFAVLKDISH